MHLGMCSDIQSVGLPIKVSHVPLRDSLLDECKPRGSSDGDSLQQHLHEKDAGLAIHPQLFNIREFETQPLLSASAYRGESMRVIQ